MTNIICYIAIVLALSSGRPSPSFAHINDLELKIAESSPSGVITIEMNNSLEKPLRIWDESNSWGAARWRVVVIRNGKTQSFLGLPGLMARLCISLRLLEQIRRERGSDPNEAREISASSVGDG
jgi:hypothetical protein